MSTWLPANNDRGSSHRVKGRADIQSARLVSPLIARVLASETYYSDGAPTWRGARTSNDAKESGISCIKRLRRFASKISLKPPELRELLEFLGRYPVGARLILRGIRRDGRRLVITQRQRPGGI